MQKNGRTPVMDVEDEMKKLRGQNKYLATKCWVDLDKQLHFDSTHVYDNLVEPAVAEVVNVELSEAIYQAQDPNPPSRSAVRFEKYLEYATDMNGTELYGAFQGCRPTLHLSAQHAYDMEVALLDFLVAKRLHLKFKQMWEAVSDHYEELVVKRWRSDCAMGRDVFVEKHRNVIGLFIDGDKLDRVEACIKANVDPELADLQACLGSPIGGALYEKQALKLQWLLFVDRAKQGVRSCLDHNFDALEVDGFTKVMNREVQDLKEQGHQKFDKKDTHVDFLCRKKMEVVIYDINDQWKNIYEAQWKSIVINLH